MAIKRRMIKVSDRYGAGIENHETRTREKMLNAEDEFRKTYSGLSKTEQKKINWNDELEKSREQVNRAKNMKFLDESDMILKRSSDRPMSIPEFTRLIKQNLHPNLMFVPNHLVGENVGGHSVYFQSREEPEFICGVGKALANQILPESEFHNVDDGTKIERKQKSRGYLAAVEMIISWLEKHQQRVINKNFLD